MRREGWEGMGRGLTLREVYVDNRTAELAPCRIAYPSHQPNQLLCPNARPYAKNNDEKSEKTHNRKQTPINPPDSLLLDDTQRSMQ